MESRKEFEERLLTELLDELRREPLSNLLSYAACYLRGETRGMIRPIDIVNAEIIEECVEKLDTRLTEERR